jgi:hypothetical protein
MEIISSCLVAFIFINSLLSKFYYSIKDCSNQPPSVGVIRLRKR